MLSLAEREEISRGIVASHPIRSIATSLGRAPSTSVVRSSVTVTDALNNQFLHPTTNGRMAFPAGSHQIQKATPKDGRCMSEFGQQQTFTLDKSGDPKAAAEYNRTD